MLNLRPSALSELTSAKSMNTSEVKKTRKPPQVNWTSRLIHDQYDNPNSSEDMKHQMVPLGLVSENVIPLCLTLFRNGHSSWTNTLRLELNVTARGVGLAY